MPRQLRDRTSSELASVLDEAGLEVMSRSMIPTCDLDFLLLCRRQTLEQELLRRIGGPFPIQRAADSTEQHELAKETWKERNVGRTIVNVIFWTKYYLEEDILLLSLHCSRRRRLDRCWADRRSCCRRHQDVRVRLQVWSRSVAWPSWPRGRLKVDTRLRHLIINKC